MVADRVCMFATPKENEDFAADLVEICGNHPFRSLVVTEADPSPFVGFAGKPGFVVEAETEDRKRWRYVVWFTRAQFTPENVGKRLREVVEEWKKIYLKQARN